MQSSLVLRIPNDLFRECEVPAIHSALSNRSPVLLGTDRQKHPERQCRRVDVADLPGAVGLREEPPKER